MKLYKIIQKLHPLRLKVGLMVKSKDLVRARRTKKNVYTVKLGSEGYTESKVLKRRIENEVFVVENLERNLNSELVGEIFRRCYLRKLKIVDGEYCYDPNEILIVVPGTEINVSFI